MEHVAIAAAAIGDHELKSSISCAKAGIEVKQNK
jgi:hypothetical protein